MNKVWIKQLNHQHLKSNQLKAKKSNSVIVGSKGHIPFQIPRKDKKKRVVFMEKK